MRNRLILSSLHKTSSCQETAPGEGSLARLRAVQQMDSRLSDHNGKGVWITTHHLGHHCISLLHYYCDEEPVSTQYFFFLVQQCQMSATGLGLIFPFL